MQGPQVPPASVHILSDDWQQRRTARVLHFLTPRDRPWSEHVTHIPRASRELEADPAVWQYRDYLLIRPDGLQRKRIHVEQATRKSIERPFCTTQPRVMVSRAFTPNQTKYYA